MERMKRWMALLLTLVLIFLLSTMPILAGDEGSTDEAESAGEMDTASPEEENGEEPEETAEAEETADQTDGGGETEAEETQQTASGPLLQFSELRDVLMENNDNIRALEEQLDDLSDIDTDELEDMVDELEKLGTSLKTLLAQVGTAIQQPAPSVPSDPSDPESPTVPVVDLTLVYQSLYVLLNSSYASVESQVSSLESQIDSAEMSVETGENSLNDGINQVVKGAETLYIGIVAMEAAVGDIQRGLDTLDRAITIMEKQYELGMASAYDLESLQYQRSTVESQLASLEFQITTSKITLESMCGMELNGTVRLGALTMPTADQLASVSYEENLQKATNRNVSVMNARVEEDYDTSSSNATVYAVDAAESSFAASFKVICLTVEEQARLVDVAEEALDFAQRTYEITAKKYELGMVSYEEYLADQSDVQQAQSDLYSAQLEVFSAYRNYLWAVNYGIV